MVRFGEAWVRRFLLDVYKSISIYPVLPELMMRRRIYDYIAYQVMSTDYELFLKVTVSPNRHLIFILSLFRMLAWHHNLIDNERIP